MKAWTSRPLRGNCLFWALRQWRRRGGYITMRTADLNVPIWHFGWMPRRGGPIYHFRPLDLGTRYPWPWARGYIRRGEDI